MKKIYLASPHMSNEKYEEKYLQAEKQIEQLKKELENITRNSLDLEY